MHGAVLQKEEKKIERRKAETRWQMRQRARNSLKQTVTNNYFSDMGLSGKTKVTKQQIDAKTHLNWQRSYWL